jgi:hypothetical protein
MVFVSTAAADGHKLSIKAGAVTGVSHEHLAHEGRVREWLDLTDPVWQAALRGRAERRRHRAPLRVRAR